MSQSTDFPAIVRLLREHHGLTQEQFAHHIGVSFSTVNVWENGKRAPLPFLRKRILEMADRAGVAPASTIAPSPRGTRR